MNPFQEAFDAIEWQIQKTFAGKEGLTWEEFRPIFYEIIGWTEAFRDFVLDGQAGSDTCWLSIYCLALVTMCWCCAITKAKSVKESKGEEYRKGWAKGIERINTQFVLVKKIGEQLGFNQVKDADDLAADAIDPEVNLKIMTELLIMTLRGKTPEAARYDYEGLEV